ncbi:hypothetical protein [Rhodoferax aquaticus]|nr:hypothetical protein [Rhodoferax aquaticus]
MKSFFQAAAVTAICLGATTAFAQDSNASKAYMGAEFASFK